MASKRRRGKFLQFTAGPNEGKQALMYYDEQVKEQWEKKKVLVHLVNENFEEQQGGLIIASAENLKVIGFFD